MPRKLLAEIMHAFARCNVGYGFINFRTSAACDEFIAKSLPELLLLNISRDLRRVLCTEGMMGSTSASASLGELLSVLLAQFGFGLSWQTPPRRLNSKKVAGVTPARVQGLEAFGRLNWLQ